MDTRWPGVPGQGVGVREVRGSNPGRTTHYCSTYFASDRLDAKSVRVKNELHSSVKGSGVFCDVFQTQVQGIFKQNLNKTHGNVS